MLPKFSVFQPNSWDNGILPIDVLHKLITEMNTLIDEVNNIENKSVEISKAYTDAEISTLNQNLTYQIRQVSNDLVAANRIISGHSTAIGAINTQIGTINGQINSLSGELTAKFNEAKDYADNAAALVKTYSDMRLLAATSELQEEINNIITIVNDILNIKTIDGFTGRYVTVREILASKIVQNTKKAGGNRYALTWKQLKLSGDGYLFNKSSRFSSNINILAPTWHNLMLNNYQFSAGQKAASFAMNMNTWGAFSNCTLLFLAEIVHKILMHSGSGTAAIANNYKYVDVFKFDEWQAWINGGSDVPSIERVDVTTTYDGTNTYLSLIVEQFKQSLSIFTGYTPGYGLYSTSANSTNTLFGGVNDLPRLFQLLYGNTNQPFYSDYF